MNKNIHHTKHDKIVTLEIGTSVKAMAIRMLTIYQQTNIQVNLTAPRSGFYW